MDDLPIDTAIDPSIDLPANPPTIPSLQQKRKCNVFSCTTRVDPFHQFPNIKKNPEESERCLQWIFVSENPELLNLSKERIFERRICGNHFEDRFKVSSRLTKSAVPTLNLPCSLGKLLII